LPAFWDSNSKKQKKKLFFQLLSIQTARATQSMMYIPLLVNRFLKIILLTIQYKYLKSFSNNFILQNLILTQDYAVLVLLLNKFSVPRDQYGNTEKICIGKVPVSKSFSAGPALK